MPDHPLDAATGRETVIVGGAWAALVAADRLAAAGEPVRLLLPTRGVGGGFASRRVGGRSLELGLRVLELHHEAAPDAADVRPLEAYDLTTTGHVPFLPLVRDYVAGLAGEDLVELVPGATAIGGRLVDDLFLTSDPAGVRAALTPAQRAAAATEVDPDRSPGALTGPAETRTLAQASRENHGATVHDALIAPFVAKVVAGGSDVVLAALRRRVWTPVLWPRSVWEACSGAPWGFRPDRPQHGVRGGVGVLVDRVVARLQAQPLVRIERVGPLRTLVHHGEGRVALGFDDARSVLAARPVLAVPAPELFAACGVPYAPERARTVVAWAELDAGDVLAAPSVVHVVDPENAAMRITVATPAAGDAGDRRLFCVELRHDLAEDAAASATRSGLVAAGIARPGAPIDVVDHVAARTFPLPVAANAAGFAAAREAFDALGLDVEVIGGGRGLAGDYLNEQIVSGLACAWSRTVAPVAA
ncbi:NAD(P)-binding protein [Patulibacter americanus]|uniref:NAD(P)-binding protein n=1 Tax=Patulibacter americanus TaxID=588672 RepID=UPI0003B32F72|nr:FAD/NAD(P)-binding protein [Patulibacter americanus]